METLTLAHQEALPDETPERLSRVPRHISEKLGEIALNLTHEFRHPMISTGEYEDFDFTKVLTGSEQASEAQRQVAQEAEKYLADLLDATTATMDRAHLELSEQGIIFGAAGAESDEARIEREAKEHRLLQDKAYDLLIEQAKKAQQDGTGESVRALEALLVMKSSDDREGYRQYHQILRGGLQDELVDALKNTTKLVTLKRNSEGLEEYGDRISPYAGSRMATLMQMATGKTFDRNWQERGTSADGIQITGMEQWVDLLAVASMSSDRGTLDQLLEQAGNTPDWLKAQLEDGASIEGLYQVTDELVGDEGSLHYIRDSEIRQFLSYSDPLYAQELEGKFGTPIAQLTSRLSRKVESDGSERSRREILDKPRFEAFLKVKEQYPDFMNRILDELNSKLELEPDELLERVSLVEKLGMSPDVFFAQIIVPNEHFAEACSVIEEYCRRANISPNDLARLDEVYPPGGTESLSRLFFRPHEAAEEYLHDFKFSLEAHDVYKSKYASLSFPIQRQEVRELSSVSLEDMPALKERLKSTGIPEDITSKMFQSWATYNAYRVKFDGKGSGFPEEALPEVELGKIAAHQVKVLRVQLKAFEQAIGELGLEKTREIIDTFGIYNFSQHTVQELERQLEVWHSGEPLRDVVVKARSDWNSFTGNKVQFKDADRVPIFFEANSATDIARVAVRVGRHERDAGREPAIGTFIIHAHGDPEGMLIGVNGETIEVGAYRRAMEARARREAALHDAPAATARGFRRHLGDGFKVILQSCSTAGNNGAEANIAQTMSDYHSVEVVGFDKTTYRLTIDVDGGVTFGYGAGEEGEATIYSVK